MEESVTNPESTMKSTTTAQPISCGKRQENPPVKWRRLVKLFEEHQWKVDRISGSHYICVKPLCRPIPLAFHGDRVLTRRYAKLVLKQARIIGDTDEIPPDDNDRCVVEFAGNVIETNSSLGDEGWAKQIPASKCLSNISVVETEYLREKREIREEGVLKEELRRQELLDRVQNYIASGDYTKAISSIDIEGIDLVGSSNENFDFSSDLIFFKIVAHTDLAFHEYTFNSKEQREAIFYVLRLSNEYMEAVCDRRKDVVILVLELQERVLCLYMEEAMQAFKNYMRVVFQVEIQDAPKESMVSLLGIDKAECSQVLCTQEYFYSQLDMMLDCLQFIVSIYQLVMKQTFRPIRAMNLIDEMQLFSLTYPCIRRMLVLFDMQDFKGTLNAAHALLFVAEHFPKGIEIALLSLSCFFPKKARQSQEVIVAIAEHVKALAPVYEFAENELKWKRFAGTVARCQQTGNVRESKLNFQRCNCTIDNALKFTDMVIQAIEKSGEHMEDLAINCMTRTFMFDTLMDPIALMKLAVEQLINTKNSLPVKFWEFLVDFKKLGCDSIDEYRMKKGSKAFSELRKSKYDPLRRQILLLFHRLQKVACIYSRYYDVSDAETQAQLDKKESYSTFRFHEINIIRYHLVFVFGLLFDPSSTSKGLTFLYKALPILLSDLDIAQAWHSDIPKMLRGECESAAEAIGIGRWSFDITYQVFAPSFLRCYINREEERRLRVIDRMGTNILARDLDSGLGFMPLGLDHLETLEKLAFSLISMLLKSPREESISELNVRKKLQILMGDSTKTEEFRRRVKNKAKKYTAKIKELSRMTLNQHKMLSCCMDSREKAVKLLMEKLEVSVLKRQKLPGNIFKQINSDKRRKEKLCLITQYSNCFQAWSYTDANEIDWALWALQDAGEAATNFIRRATSYRYPVTKSLSNPTWSQNVSSAWLDNRDVINAIYDMVCIHEILNLSDEASVASV